MLPVPQSHGLFPVQTPHTTEVVQTRISASPVVVPKRIKNVELSSPVTAPPVKPVKWDYKAYIDSVNDGRVVSARIRQDQKSVSITTLDGESVSLVLPDGYDSINFLMNAGVDVSIEKPFTLPPVFGVMTVLLQLAMFRFAFNMISSSNKGITRIGSLFGGGQKQEDDESGAAPTTRFSDVAGAHAAKRDLMEVVDFLKHPETYQKLGARVPRGLLLTGAPGCGKSLLAKAVAGEANVPFFTCAASEFVELFVGVGASRVRALFDKAEKLAPAIIFIDEIDSIGKNRNNAMGGEEREQTLNQLLVRLDGFNSNMDGKPVVVIAATNRPETLDEALTRPGRFDRIIEIPPPDVIDREAILQVHSRNKTLAPDVCFKTLAKNTSGFSGAALANLANEAALMAARNKHAKIMMNDWTQALDKVLLGEENAHQSLDDLRTKQTDEINGEFSPAIVFAYHEAGHALMSILSSDFDDIRKVTIISRGRAGGVTLFEPNAVHDGHTVYTKEYLKNQIMVGLAGRAAEEIVFGKNKVTTGAHNDFQRVTSIAYDMISRYGFGDILGSGSWTNDTITHDLVADEVQNILELSYKHTLDTLKQYEPFLHRIAKALLKQGTVTLSDIRNIISGISCDRINEKP